MKLRISSSRLVTLVHQFHAVRVEISVILLGFPFGSQNIADLQISHKGRQAQKGEFVFSLLNSAFIHIEIFSFFLHSHRDVFFIIHVRMFHCTLQTDSHRRLLWVELGHMHLFKTITGQRKRDRFKLIMNYFLRLNGRPSPILPEIKGYLKIKDYFGREDKKHQKGCWVEKGHCEPQLTLEKWSQSSRTCFVFNWFIFVVIYLTAFARLLLYIQDLPYNLCVVHKELNSIQTCPQENIAWWQVESMNVCSQTSLSVLRPTSLWLFLYKTDVTHMHLHTFLKVENLFTQH